MNAETRAEPKPARKTGRPRPRSSIAVVLLAAGFGGALLYFAHAVFVPIALATLFALLLSGPVEVLHRRKLPRTVGAAFILLMFLGVAGVTVDLLWDPAQQWLAAAPRTASVIQRKLGPASRIMQRIDAVTNRAGHLTDSGGSAAAPPQNLAPAANGSGSVLAQTREVIVSAVTIAIMTLFLLAGGPPVLARMTAAFATRANASHVLKVIEAVRSEVGRYYATIAVINLGLGVATCAAMTLLRMPNPR